jgi:SpoVK/Ycf46/Vps4 family AAA+-type ATPase
MATSSSMQAMLQSVQNQQLAPPPPGALIIRPLRLPNGQFAPKDGSTPKTNPKTKKKGVSFDSVILSDEKKQQIIDAIQQVDHHELIFEKWGFKEVFEKGTAISLLFYGMPGTGKTLMAQAIADKYDRKLTVIGAAEVQTPEPGGAERNLKKAFKTALDENAVLLFDECDSLITDRQRVGMILSAQINCLLTELEQFTGIVIFTTNRLGDLDPAFDRRVSLKLEFPMPTAELRVKIWKRMFPKKAPLAKDIRWTDLAQIEIAGGHIKNVVLRAARAAASKGLDRITDEVIWTALEQEVSSSTAFSGAINRSSWYGTPIAGGMQAGLTRKLTT